MSRRIVLECESTPKFPIKRYFNIEFSEEDYKQFKSLPLKKQVEYLRDYGDFIVTEYECNQE